MMKDLDWRLDQLKFLLVYGLCQIENVGVELARKYYFSFFGSLKIL